MSAEPRATSEDGDEDRSVLQGDGNEALHRQQQQQQPPQPSWSTWAATLGTGVRRQLTRAVTTSPFSPRTRTPLKTGGGDIRGRRRAVGAAPLSAAHAAPALLLTNKNKLLCLELWEKGSHAVHRWLTRADVLALARQPCVRVEMVTAANIALREALAEMRTDEGMAQERAFVRQTEVAPGSGVLRHLDSDTDLAELARVEEERFRRGGGGGVERSRRSKGVGRSRRSRRRRRRERGGVTVGAASEAERNALLLQKRDLRLIDPFFSFHDEPCILVRRRCVLVHIPPVRALILEDRVMLFPEEGADGDVGLLSAVLYSATTSHFDDATPSPANSPAEAPVSTGHPTTAAAAAAAPSELQPDLEGTTASSSLSDSNDPMSFDLRALEGLLFAVSVSLCEGVLELRRATGIVLRAVSGEGTSGGSIAADVTLAQMMESTAEELFESTILQIEEQRREVLHAAQARNSRVAPGAAAADESMRASEWADELEREEARMRSWKGPGEHLEGGEVASSAAAHAAGGFSADEFSAPVLRTVMQGLEGRRRIRQREWSATHFGRMGLPDPFAWLFCRSVFVDETSGPSVIAALSAVRTIVQDFVVRARRAVQAVESLLDDPDDLPRLPLRAMARADASRRVRDLAAIAQSQERVVRLSETGPGAGETVTTTLLPSRLPRTYSWPRSTEDKDRDFGSSAASATRESPTDDEPDSRLQDRVPGAEELCRRLGLPESEEEAVAEVEGAREGGEILLESYLATFGAILHLGEALDARLRLADEYLSLHLASARNVLLRAEVLFSLAAVSIGLVSSVAGIFGMNLHSGLEESRPSAPPP